MLRADCCVTLKLLKQTVIAGLALRHHWALMACCFFVVVFFNEWEVCCFCCCTHEMNTEKMKTTTTQLICYTVLLQSINSLADLGEDFIHWQLRVNLKQEEVCKEHNRRHSHVHTCSSQQSDTPYGQCRGSHRRQWLAQLLCNTGPGASWWSPHYHQNGHWSRHVSKASWPWSPLWRPRTAADKVCQSEIKAIIQAFVVSADEVEYKSTCPLISYLLLELLSLLHLTGIAINKEALGHISLGDHGILNHV